MDDPEDVKIENSLFNRIKTDMRKIYKHKGKWDSERKKECLRIIYCGYYEAPIFDLHYGESRKWIDVPYSENDLEQLNGNYAFLNGNGKKFVINDEEDLRYLYPLIDKELLSAEASKEPRLSDENAVRFARYIKCVTSMIKENFPSSDIKTEKFDVTGDSNAYAILELSEKGIFREKTYTTKCYVNIEMTKTLYKINLPGKFDKLKELKYAEKDNCGNFYYTFRTKMIESITEAEEGLVSYIKKQYRENRNYYL